MLNFWTSAYILVNLWSTVPQNQSVPPRTGVYLYVEFGEDHSRTVTCTAQTDKQCDNATDKSNWRTYSVSQKSSPPKTLRYFHLR